MLETPHAQAREPGVGAELYAPLPDYDLDVLDRASTRSTTSGQSATPSKTFSEEDLVSRKISGQEEPDNLEELQEQFEKSMTDITRTLSCPAHLSENQPESTDVCDEKLKPVDACGPSSANVKKSPKPKSKLNATMLCDPASLLPRN